MKIFYRLLLLYGVEKMINCDKILIRYRKKYLGYMICVFNYFIFYLWVMKLGLVYIVIDESVMFNYINKMYIFNY